MRIVLMTVLLASVASAPALAADDELETPKQVATAIETALRKGENPGVALKAAEALRDDFDADDMAPVVKAAGMAFKSDKRLHQCLVLDTYAVLDVPGSTKQFVKLLDVPDHVEGTLLRNTYALAIKTAGALHEKDALKGLEKLLAHPDRRFARTAAEALAGYVDLADKDKGKLVKRLVKTLGKTERDLDHKDEDVAKRAADVTAALDATLGALTGQGPAPEEGAVRSADDWGALLAGKGKGRGSR